MKNHPILQSLPLADWQPTRDSLHECAVVLGTIRGVLAPPEPHWAHVSLRVVGDGLTTTPLPIAHGHCEIRLNLQGNRLEFVHLQGRQTDVRLAGQPQAIIAAWLLEQLRPLHPKIDSAQLPTWNKTPRSFDPAASTRFGRILVEITSVFEQIRLHLPGRSSNVQFWPHHFDLAFLWFSGRKVPDKNPTDLDSSDEQVNLGFVTGDASVNDAYFYATAYPEPAGLAQKTWPKPGHWFTDGWHGVAANYADFLKSSDPSHALATWTEQVHAQFRTALPRPKV